MQQNTRGTILNTDNRFAIIPHWVIFSGISAGALKLYAVLTKYADHATRQAFPSRTTLGRDVGVSRKTIDRYIRELEALGALRVQRRKRKGSKENLVSLYTVITANPAGVGTPVSPPRDTSVTENQTHSSTPSSSTSSALASREAPSTPSPSGADHTLERQLEASKEATTHLVDIVVHLYRTGQWYWSDDNDWVTLEEAFESHTDLYVGDAVSNRGWATRLQKIMDDHIHVGERYAASVYLGMLANFVRAYG